HDQVDPDKIKTILKAIPDIWAERFVENAKSDLEQYGLKEPAETVGITQANGQTVTVLVGKQSRVERKIVMQPGPPMFGQPGRPMPKEVTEEYRYAKLKTNRETLNKIFEIKAAHLKDLALPAGTVRDPALARFTTNDVRRVELTFKGKPKIVLVNKDGDWKLHKPEKKDAEPTKVTELLDKLADLKAEGADVIDASGKAGLRKYGLASPAGTIDVTVEEEVKDTGAKKKKKKKTKEYHFALGNKDPDTSKIYVLVKGRDRINAVDDSLLKLAARPSLAYRGKQVLKFSSADLAKIEVRRAKDPFTLEQVKNKWRLAAP